MGEGKHIFPKNGREIFLREGLDTASDNTKLICPTGRRAEPGRIAFFVMAGLVPPARPKPLRRGEGPAIHVFLLQMANEDVDARRKAGHDEG
jgi:hypothetical protein